VHKVLRDKIMSVKKSLLKNVMKSNLDIYNVLAKEALQRVPDGLHERHYGRQEEFKIYGSTHPFA
jgi:hypothetical protein